MTPQLRWAGCLILFASAALTSARAAGPQTRPAAPSTQPALAIYVVDASLRVPALQPAAASDPMLILAAWPDGRIIWSRDGGGPPYLAGRFDPELLSRLAADLDQRGAFDNKSLSHVRYGPDSAYTVMRIRWDQKEINLRSWHELFEQNPKLVVTAQGVSALNGRTREEVMAGQPAEYRDYRALWDIIRATTQSWIPKDAKPYEGALPLD